MAQGQAIVPPLELIVQDDLIWTYGGFSPRLPIPDLIPRRSQGLAFLGVAGEKSIQVDFWVYRSRYANFEFQLAESPAA